MHSSSVSRLEPEAFNQILEALRTVGVAGNEDDRRFDAQDLKVERDELERILKKDGHLSGSLAIQTIVRTDNDLDVIVYDTGRYSATSQAEQAWEQAYQLKWHHQVERSVEDWITRLKDLRSLIAGWVKEVPEFSSLSMVDLRSAVMLEDLMRQFNVASRQMPVFELRSGSQRVMRFQPKGLWIIGANGRVDLITKSDAPILVDVSERFTPSNWQMYYSRNKGESVPLTPKSFKQLVRPGLE